MIAAGQILSPALTYEDIAALRAVAEMGCDPGIYEMAAQGFDALDMPCVAGAMRRRAEHYQSIDRSLNESGN